MTKEELKQRIRETIRTNGQGEISGVILQQRLVELVDSLPDEGSMGVNADWNEENPDSKAFILNKPTIPPAYNDTELREEIKKKQDAETGKGLSTNDYTTSEKNKLANLENYNDTEVRGLITGLQDALDALSGEGDTTQVIDTMREIIAFLDTFKNSESLASVLSALQTTIQNWVEDKGYLTEHQQLKTINNQSIVGGGNINTPTYDDTSLRSKVAELEGAVNNGVTASATSASQAAASASRAQTSAANAESKYNGILEAMQSLPDGSAVSAQVALNTQKVTELTIEISDSINERQIVSKTYYQTFNGTLYPFTSYYYCYLTPIYGNLSKARLQVDNGAVVTIFKYERSLSRLTQIGTATATSDGVLEVNCNNAEFNGELVAFGTSSKLGFRQKIGDVEFGSIYKNGTYRSEGIYDYSVEFEMQDKEERTVKTLSTLEENNKFPINSNAILNSNLLAKSEPFKVQFFPFTMTSAGTIYEDPTRKHSQYIDVDSFFLKCSIFFYYAIKAWVFFDKDYKVVGSYQPSSDVTLTIEGRLADIPANAKYVVFNQLVNTFVEMYAIVPQERKNTKWSGKNVLYFGDSFFDQNTLPNTISNVLGTNTINRGVSGSVVASKGGSSYQSLVDRIDGYVDNTREHYSALPQTCDMVIINCTTNDFGTNIPLGTFEDGYSDKSTYYGGLHYVIRKLVEKYGNTPIVWIAPTHRASAGLQEFIFTEDGHLNVTKNSQNLSLKDYVNALRKVCEMYSIPLVDCYAESRIQPIFDDNKNAYTNDGLHPNNNGAYLMALKVKEAIDYMSQ